MTEPRSVWLRTQNGVPMSFVWALTKREADCTTPNVSWECALTTADHPAPAWDATMTNWRSVPPLLYPDSLDAGSPTLSGRVLEIADCSFDLDVGGRPSSFGTEPLPPDTTVGVIEELVAHVETLGRDVDFIEKDTLKKCRVYTTEPGDPFAGGSVDSAFYRQTSDSIAVRNDAP